jgi:hypothetical protein
MTGGLPQCSGDQRGIRRVQPAERVAQVHANPLSDARRQTQHPLLATRAGQPSRIEGSHRCRPVHRDHRDAVSNALESLGELIDKVASQQPQLMADQQFDGCLGAKQASGMFSQGFCEVLEAGSK